jgi:hypothetical protein
LALLDGLFDDVLGVNLPCCSTHEQG